MLSNARDRTECIVLEDLTNVLDEIPHVNGSMHGQLDPFILPGGGLMTIDLPEPAFGELKCECGSSSVGAQV